MSAEKYLFCEDCREAISCSRNVELLPATFHLRKGRCAVCRVQVYGQPMTITQRTDAAWLRWSDYA